MERLTERNGNYVVINMKKHCPFGKKPKWCNYCKIHNHEEQRKVCPVLQMLDRLAAYEDIGLSPNDIPHWIPVSERMPEKSGRYLVLSKMNWAYGGTWDGNDGDIRRNMALAYFDGAVKFNIPYVTHWMELPAGPEEVRATI